MSKPKKVSYELILRDSTVGHPMYTLLDDIVQLHHEELAGSGARIALAWCSSWRPDTDGRVVLGKCKKASDLDRELAAFDFVILLSRFFWRSPEVTDEQRRALLDHELCHARVKFDERGVPAKDERDRYVFRVRKHDIEEFTEIVTRHGTYKADLEQFAAALVKRGVPPYVPCGVCEDRPGWTVVRDTRGAERVTRCQCFIEWQERKRDAKGAA